MGGGALDYQIHEAAGEELLKECRKIPIINDGVDGDNRNPAVRCITGDSKITKAYNMKNARYVIHTVGPDMRQETDLNLAAQQLADCYTSSLNLAASYRCQSIAFPAISTGVYRFDKEEAATIAIHTVTNFLATNSVINNVQFYCFDKDTEEIYRRLLPAKLSPSSYVPSKSVTYNASTKGKLVSFKSFFLSISWFRVDP